MTRLLLTALIAVSLSACAPTRFEKQTDSLASSTSNLSTNVEASYSALALDEASLAATTSRLSGAVTAFSASCAPTTLYGPDRIRKPSCTLATSVPEQITRSPAWTTEPISEDVTTSLARYAAGLRELTSAASRQEMEQSVDAIATSAATLLALTGTGGAVAPISAAAIKTVGFVVVEAQEARRFRLLRNSVREGQRAVEGLGTVLGAALDTVRRERIRLAIAEGEQMAKSMLSTASNGRAALHTAIARKAADVALLQRADPRDAVDAVVQVHTALRDALEKNDGQLVALNTALDSLSKRVGELRTTLAAVDGKGSV